MICVSCDTECLGVANMCKIHILQLLLDSEESPKVDSPIDNLIDDLIDDFKEIKVEPLKDIIKEFEEMKLELDDCEFIGTGLRPPGKFLFNAGGEEIVIGTPIFISAIHKLMRRDQGNYLSGLLKGGFTALSKREQSTGIKSVTTQYKNRLLMAPIEEGVMLLIEPKKADQVVDITLELFNKEDLEEKLELVDQFCIKISGCYRGRLISWLMAWFTTDRNILEKLNIESPPPVKDLSSETLAQVSNLNLGTKRDKLILCEIVTRLKAPQWIFKMIQVVSHKEFNRFLYVSAVLNQLELWEDLPEIEEIEEVESKIPSINHLKEIGVYDCHSGKGNFNDFLDVGMKVENLAPTQVFGKSLQELEEIYLTIKKEVGSSRFK